MDAMEKSESLLLSSWMPMSLCDHESNGIELWVMQACGTSSIIHTAYFGVGGSTSPEFNRDKKLWRCDSDGSPIDTGLSEKLSLIGWRLSDVPSGYEAYDDDRLEEILSSDVDLLHLFNKAGE